MTQDFDDRGGSEYFPGVGRGENAVAPAKVFVDRIQRNPEVCSNCFVKIRDVVIPHSWRRSVREGLVRYYVSKETRTESAAIEGDRAGNPPKACKNCGSIRGATNRPLPKSRAVEYAWNLSTTLRELKIDHNPVVLAFVVAHRKRFPRFAMSDDDTFRLAVEYALDATEYGMADVLGTKGIDTDPANIVRDDGRFVVDVIVERPALPAADD
jgi:hypothetical protein